ncbi:hypothetical protein POM88_018587 [Heracleum sosnowskyi]|uniref:Protein kinase domain-containing protein n=1 Tax=Heracleum sosnowskyi TaxID=360622 RepID=A0AAD8MZ41_9APIA|nr:hypothetical protein POM88_018587 [Heracleum sosnowskyi]
MSPEYAIVGHFLVKSDVYNYGILLIAIVSRKTNRLSRHPCQNLNLLGHAWKSCNEDTVVGRIDELILESSNQMEQSYQNWFVQEDPIDRPVMSEVVLMLSSIMKLPHP